MSRHPVGDTSGRGAESPHPSRAPVCTPDVPAGRRARQRPRRSAWPRGSTGGGADGRYGLGQQLNVLSRNLPRAAARAGARRAPPSSASTSTSSRWARPTASRPRRCVSLLRLGRAGRGADRVVAHPQPGHRRRRHDSRLAGPPPAADPASRRARGVLGRRRRQAGRCSGGCRPATTAASPRRRCSSARSTRPTATGSGGRRAPTRPPTGRCTPPCSSVRPTPACTTSCGGGRPTRATTGASPTR